MKGFLFTLLAFIVFVTAVVLLVYSTRPKQVVQARPLSALLNPAQTKCPGHSCDPLPTKAVACSGPAAQHNPHCKPPAEQVVTVVPSEEPTKDVPTQVPTNVPSPVPTQIPTQPLVPTQIPTNVPTQVPTQPFEPSPTVRPPTPIIATSTPSEPKDKDEPTAVPTVVYATTTPLSITGSTAEVCEDTYPCEVCCNEVALDTLYYAQATEAVAHANELQAKVGFWQTVVNLLQQLVGDGGLKIFAD